MSPEQLQDQVFHVLFASEDDGQGVRVDDRLTESPEGEDKICGGIMQVFVEKLL